MAVPLQPGTAVDVRENHFLVATSPVDLRLVRDRRVVHDQRRADGRRSLGGGMKLLKVGIGHGRRRPRRSEDDRTSTAVAAAAARPSGTTRSAGTSTASRCRTAPGLLLLHAGGNVFVRTLAAGETIMVKPPALLFKDPTVGMQLHVEYPQCGHAVLALVGQPVPVAADVGPGPGRGAVGLREAGGPGIELPEHLGPHRVPLVGGRWPGHA